MDESLKRQIELAKKGVKKLKKATPHIFPQYCRMKEAERQLKLAKNELREAKEVWKNL
jgi:hypothetical protein